MSAANEWYLPTAAGLLILAGVVIAVLFPVKWPLGYEHAWLDKPILSLELPHDSSEFTLIVDDSREKVIRAQYADFVYIAVYGAFFFVLAYALQESRTRHWIVVATILTMLADCGENVAIIHAVHETTASALRAIHVFGSVKWVAFFVITLLVAVAIWGSGGALRIAALLLFASGTAGILGSAASWQSVTGRLFVSASSAVAALALLIVVIAMTVKMMGRT